MLVNIVNYMDFSTAIDRLKEHAKKTPTQIAKILILDINQRAIDTSRVDTGRYVGGWQISINDSPIFATNPYDDGVDRKEQEEQIKNSQITDNQERALYFKGGTIFLANNVEYAIFREFGTPYQKPDYTLTLAIQAALNRLNEIADELEFKG